MNKKVIIDIETSNTSPIRLEVEDPGTQIPFGYTTLNLRGTLPPKTETKCELIRHRLMTSTFHDLYGADATEPDSFLTPEQYRESKQLAEVNHHRKSSPLAKQRAEMLQRLNKKR